jgi:cobalt/nickel transport system permease protein
LSHLHIPDGILPLWLVAAGWAAAAVLVAIAVGRLTSEGARRRVPLVGAMAALMLVGMSSEIIPIAYHINLTVLAGILLGPWLSIIAALVVDIMLALVGHGGITVVGLNTLVISAEMILGWALFAAFVRVLSQRRAGLAAGLATVLALALSTTVLIGIVALGGPPAAARESGAFDPQSLRFDNPFSGGLAGNALLSGGERATGEPHAEGETSAPLPIVRFATMVYVLGSIGWVIEALITALIVGFVARVRPGLVFEGAVAQPPRGPLGDEGTSH